MKLETLEYKFYDNTTRNVYILLPDNIESDTKIKTLYMFDAQSTIKESKFTNSSWQVDKAIDDKDINNLCIVSIDNADDRRINEYLPFDFNHHGKNLESSGIELGEWLVNTLIPDLEKKYPLTPNKNSRFLAGSSMGGIITAAYSAKFKDYFSKYGVFSLASWMFNDNSFYDFLDKEKIYNSSSYFVYVGDKEGYSTDNDYETKKVTKAYLKEYYKFVDYLKDQNVSDIKTCIGEGYNHSEIAWKEFFPLFLDMLEI